jgi:hypothetical protein
VHSRIISAENLTVSRTYKDARQNRVLEVVKREDGTFDLFLNRRLYLGQISEERLPWELCVRFGYCQDEYEPIRRELAERGKKELFLSG